MRIQIWDGFGIWLWDGYEGMDIGWAMDTRWDMEWDVRLWHMDMGYGMAMRWDCSGDGVIGAMGLGCCSHLSPESPPV